MSFKLCPSISINGTVYLSVLLSMAPLLTWNNKLSIHRTSPSVHLASLWNVHGRSFLTHMVVITIRYSFPFLLFLETRIRVVIPVIGCSKRLTGSNLQSCAWTRSQVISSMTKTPSPLLSAHHQCCKRQNPKGNHSPKKVQSLVWRRMMGKGWRPGGPWTENST